MFNLLCVVCSETDEEKENNGLLLPNKLSLFQKLSITVKITQQEGEPLTKEATVNKCAV